MSCDSLSISPSTSVLQFRLMVTLLKPFFAIFQTSFCTIQYKMDLCFVVLAGTVFYNFYREMFLNGTVPQHSDVVVRQDGESEVPRPGYKAITIGEDVYNQVIENMRKENELAGFKKFRNVSHFIEQSVVNFVVGVIKNKSESPDRIIEKVVEVMWDRPSLIRGVFDKLLAMSEDEASALLSGLFSPEDLDHMKRICAKLSIKKKHNPGPGKAHVLMDIGGKILYMNRKAHYWMPGRSVGSSLWEGSALNADSVEYAHTLLKKALSSKEELVEDFMLTYKDGRKVRFRGEARLVPGGYGEKVFEIFFEATKTERVQIV